jgi:hypothetical protein
VGLKSRLMLNLDLSSSCKWALISIKTSISLIADHKNRHSIYKRVTRQELSDDHACVREKQFIYVVPDLFAGN